MLGRDNFAENIGFLSITSQTSYGKTTRDGRKILVVDTPGLLDNREDVSFKDTIQEMLKCISVTSPGIHSLILVLGLERFTEENAKVFEVIMQLFGSELKKYLIVVFTKKDQMLRCNMSLEQLIEKSPKALKNIIHNYCRDYMAIDNTKPYETNEDASLLIHKINEIVESNGGQFYTSESYQIAEEFFRDDVRRLNNEGSLNKRINAERSAEVFSRALPKLYQQSYGFEGRNISYTSYSGEGGSSGGVSSYSDMVMSNPVGITSFPSGGMYNTGREASKFGFSYVEEPYQKLTHNDGNYHLYERVSNVDNRDENKNSLPLDSIGGKKEENTATRKEAFTSTFILDQKQLEKKLKERNQASINCNKSIAVVENKKGADRIVQVNKNAVDGDQQQVVEVNDDLWEDENLRDAQRKRFLRNEDDVIRGFWAKMNDRINRFIEAIKGIFKRN